MTATDDSGYASLTDEELVRRDGDGDTSAFDMLIDRHASRILGFLFRSTGDRALSEDLLQETFLKAFRNRRGWRGESRFSTWLVQIARNLLIDRFRWMGRWRSVSIDEMDTQPERAIRSGDPSPEEAALRRERHDELRAAILRLPERQREVLLLSRYCDMSYAEIARLTGVTEDAIKQLAYRGVLALRRDLTGSGEAKDGVEPTPLRRKRS
ncbi:MAG: sigma-70 family RNA polymerase sigma factor [Candidatus Wallbacteria bacterium]|nr:sigma-70 family RNA polymerase sigma factor [Candidatus Wallbacteria bacterium]